MPAPEGVPRRGKGKSAPPADEFFKRPRSSRGSRKEGFHFLSWGHPPKALPWPVVDKLINFLELRFPDFRKRRLLGIDPSNEPVGVLIGASLPRAEKLEGQELILDIFNSCGARNEFLISEI